MCNILERKITGKEIKDFIRDNPQSEISKELFRRYNANNSLLFNKCTFCDDREYIITTFWVDWKDERTYKVYKYINY